MVLGHEFCGIVTDAGRPVDQSLLGKRVFVEPSTPADGVSSAAPADTIMPADRHIGTGPAGTNGLLFPAHGGVLSGVGYPCL
jgi:threonine dehydrogenase-like Zn-dependent dehydrogenase